MRRRSYFSGGTVDSPSASKCLIGGGWTADTAISLLFLHEAQIADDGE